MTVVKIVFEKTIVFDTIWVLVVPLTMFLAIEELTSVRCAVFPDLLTLSIGQITKPFTSISVILGLIDHCAFSLCYIVSHLSFVITASGEDKTTLAMRKTIGKGTDIITAIFEEELTISMRLLILPRTSVDHSR